ncbi:MAG: amidohydrolase family protein [Gammaproteobacteria bacterium]|nr:amidohydrolase family protein [Gammaproteobacteria bacterium]
MAADCGPCPAWLSACGTPPETPAADLVLYDASIVTLNEAQPKAQAMAIEGERIVAVGSNGEIKPYIGPSTQAIDLDGMLVIPGFIDSHAHFMNTGRSLMQLDLRADRAPTWAAVVARVAAAVKQAKPGEWITGCGWHQEDWTHPSQRMTRMQAFRSYTANGAWAMVME